MNIDVSKLFELWYENEEGEIRHTLSIEEANLLEKEGFIYLHSMFPNLLQHRILKSRDPEEVKFCRHSPKHIKKTYGWIDGMEGRECQKCHGFQIKNELDPWPTKWEAYGSREVCTINMSWSEDLVLAMANSGKYTLSQSILIAANACSRCMNVLAFNFGLKYGFAENSEEYQNHGTECKFCKS